MAMDTFRMANRVYWIIALRLLLAAVNGDDNTSSTVSAERSAEDGNYMGCYYQTCLDPLYHPILSEMTPESCTAACKQLGYRVAAVYNRTECSCSCELQKVCHSEKLEDNYCGLPCRGDALKLCGGYLRASVYHVFAGTLGDMCSPQKQEKPGLQIIISVPMVPVASIVIIIGCMVHRRHRHRRLGRQPTTYPPEADVVKEAPSDTSDTNSVLDKLTQDPVSHVYAEADQCHFSTQAKRNKFPRNPDPGQEGIEIMDAVQDNKGYRGYVDMHSKGSRSRGEETVRDSMTDADGYVIQDGPGIRDVPYEAVASQTTK
ncbi:uncharacterized protein LOC121430476 [Lytechinus variegatus]|uniref:uncharacterized protein LOC121430476 n=1 Tax=Lytechinus variegatus TaxID=7654 RepID=UPI001BB14054|nr:uncharacterized protein LOC121430476 [Lytechinus variegatus]